MQKTGSLHNSGAKNNIRSSLDSAIEKARNHLLSKQHKDGHWCYEFEADCTIPAEYILMMHFMDEVDECLQQKIARYLKAHQNEDGGWSLYPGGSIDISCSVKAYYALKLAGESVDSDFMRQARKAILAAGGAECSNVFTRIMLAQFKQIPWQAVPFMPVELIFAPKWFFIQIYKVSYWSRTVMVPLLVLVSLRCTAKNSTGTDIQELFVTEPGQVKQWFIVRSKLNRLFLVLERTFRRFEPLIPDFLRKKAIKAAENWIIERLNGTGGLGAIFPAMVNAYEMLAALGYDAGHPYRRDAKKALDRLLIDRNDGSSYCQPCVSPVWDTGLAALALMEAGGANECVEHAYEWLAERQLFSEPGDWQVNHPNLKGGGWAFQYKNDHYPDIDDTSVIAWGMYISNSDRWRKHVKRAGDWIAGMQSANGGFAAFDSDNVSYYLNEIPFADHGALLDPPTEDVSARALTFFSLVKDSSYDQTRNKVFHYLSEKQHPDGYWWGRWGTNYIYGTWSVLMAYEAAKIPKDNPMIQKAVHWLKSIQNYDGGFGESNDTYNIIPTKPGAGSSTPEQTAWALLALMAAGDYESDALEKGIDWLLKYQNDQGTWSTTWFNAPGFPRVFYLRYHGYSEYFPLWALAKYRNYRTGPLA